MHVRVPAARRPAPWRLSLYPDAGEAGGRYCSGRDPVRVYVPAGQAADRERSKVEAAKTARRKVRRYCAANGLTRLVTLTYGPPRCTDPDLLREHVGQFFRDLRQELGGKPLPYLWVPELHKDGVHFHVHIGVNRFIPKKVISSTWGRGIVDITYLSDLPVGASTREVARRTAGYLSKYVTKTFDTPGQFGRHRYEVAQGFQPVVQHLTGWSSYDVLNQACEVMGAEPITVWTSDEAQDWQAPPAVWSAWA